MPAAAKSLPPDPANAALESFAQRRGISTQAAAVKVWLEIAVAYALIEAALWTLPGPLMAVWILAAMVAIGWFTARGPYTASELGLSAPKPVAIVQMVAIGLLAAGMIWLLAGVSHSNTPPTHALPWRKAWLYGLWALAQQFMLQSFFFVRLETLLGSRWARAASAVLFAAAHIPNTALTGLSLCGGLFFCEMFRRYRNIYPLGLVHALLGLTIAASFSDALLRHMRVGIGYATFR